MRHSKAFWLAWALCALVCGLSAVGLALTLAGPTAPRLAPALVKTVLESAIPVVFGVIVAHQPRNTIGWLLMVIPWDCQLAGSSGATSRFQRLPRRIRRWPCC